MAREATNPVEKEIRALEDAVFESKKKLSELRRKAPPKEFQDYIFKGAFNNDVKLSELFGDKTELIVIHNMGVKCPYCTLWADGFNGFTKHLENRTAFVVESPDDASVQRSFALDRGWTFKMVSSKNNTFRKDSGYVDKNGGPEPGVSVFTKTKDGKIARVSDSQFGPGDNFCAHWDLLDLLPGTPAGEVGYYYSKVK